MSYFREIVFNEQKKKKKFVNNNCTANRGFGASVRAILAKENPEATGSCERAPRSRTQLAAESWQEVVEECPTPDRFPRIPQFLKEKQEKSIPGEGAKRTETSNRA